MRIPLYFVVAADRARSIIEAMGLEYEVTPGHPRIRLGGTWFLVYRCSGPGTEGQPPTDTWTIQGNPSSGTGERWAIYLLHPEEPFRRRAKELWQAIRARVESPENTSAQGQKHILGVFTPARFAALAPPSIVADVAPGGALPHVIFGDDPVTLSAADDADLEEPA